jgi:UDP-glucose 4-epimerase
MLLQRGHRVVVLDSLARGHAAAIPADAEFLQVDLRDEEATLQAVAGASVEAVLHFAALHLVPESVEQPAEYYRTNVVGGLNLLDAVRAAGIRKFVFSSTAAVYGIPADLPIREDAPTNPINPYGESKLMVERMLASYGATYGINHAIFRYFNVAGAHGSQGEDHRPETHVIPVAIEAITGKRDTFTVFGTDYATNDGTAIRDYVHVVDLVEAHLIALERLDTNLGVFNLGTRAGFTVNQVVQAVELTTDQRLPVAYGPRRAGDPPALIADSTRAREELGWEPSHSTLDLMIGSHWDWVRNHPQGYPPAAS